MKKIIIFIIVLAVMLLGSASTIGVQEIDDPSGVPLYVIIEASWDGSSEYGDWTVWGPLWDPEVGGTMLAVCTSCLEMNYDF